MKSSSVFRSVIAASVFAVASHAALAQGVKSESLDVSIGTGYVYLNTSGTVGDEKSNHATLDMSASYNFTRRVSIGFEYTHTTLDDEQVSGTQLTRNLDSYGSVARFGLAPNRLVAPYVLAAGGVLKLVDMEIVAPFGLTSQEMGGYFGAGVGANAYLGHGFGLRPEFRYQRETLDNMTPAGLGEENIGRNEVFLTGSLFYQFGGRGR